MPRIFFIINWFSIGIHTLSDEIMQEKEKKPNEDYNNGALDIILNR